jgi:hypothetical protein
MDTGVYRGTVIRVDTGDVFVEIGKLAPGYEFGPVSTTVDPTSLAAGDSVLLVQVGDYAEDLALIGKLF